MELVFEIHWEFSEAEPKNSEAAQKLHDLPKYFRTFVFFYSKQISTQTGWSPSSKNPYVSGHEKSKKLTLQKFKFWIPKMAPYLKAVSPPFPRPIHFWGPKTPFVFRNVTSEAARGRLLVGAPDVWDRGQPAQGGSTDLQTAGKRGKDLGTGPGIFAPTLFHLLINGVYWGYNLKPIY